MNGKEAMKRLKISRTKLYFYIQNGELIPENPHTFRMEGEYRIPDEQVEALYEKLYPGGITTKEAAAYIGCKPAVIYQAIKNQKLTTHKAEGNYYIEEDEKLEMFKETYRQKLGVEKKTSHYNKQNRTYLFQSYVHRSNGELARIMSIKGDEGYALDAYGERISVTQLLLNYYPCSPYHLGKSTTRKGKVTFRFVKPTHIRSLTYTFIETLVVIVGLKQVRIEEIGTEIEVTCKPFIFRQGEENHDLAELAKRSLVSGKVVQQNNEFAFFSTDKEISLSIDEDQYEALRIKAATWGMTVEEYIVRNLNLIER
ncbi:helix-turn-helix domain-containing protein [Alkalihalophilus marmarensis]|uniref:helix-turn-helix domain-containing protein n=1 Tax=Alkalihalophilus marmarensis TaxID=521377 RepID=UPI002DBC6E52|nr:helix-turn-helix domain-containing protein [Alkalihalophilus marmarensis]MEC2074355.1 helix-turn-helix domain-containing protein [Alkalihalophilus marmarensis]